jgi:hypothetical protein
LDWMPPAPGSSASPKKVAKHIRLFVERKLKRISEDKKARRVSGRTRRAKPASKATRKVKKT